MNLLSVNSYLMEDRETCPTRLVLASLPPFKLSRNYQLGDNEMKHGLTKTNLFRRWCGILQRLNNPNAKGYHRYGGRGIKICDEWKEFINFYNWAMNNGYRKDLQIDRIDNDGNYEPSNCRWVTSKQSMRNTSTTGNVLWEGKYYTYGELADKFDIIFSTLKDRIQMGWSLEKALKTPKYEPLGINYQGKKITLYELSKKCGVRTKLLYQRLILLNWPIEKAISTPVIKNGMLKYNGEVKSTAEWGKITGISRKIICSRITFLGWSVEKALTTPVKFNKRSLKGGGSNT